MDSVLMMMVGEKIMGTPEEGCGAHRAADGDVQEPA
jgi:hypothetical protein